MFFLVVVFGLFHGLVFLPVILSLIGPAPYADHTNTVEARENHNTTQTNQRQQPKVKSFNNEMTIVVDGKSISCILFNL